MRTFQDRYRVVGEVGRGGEGVVHLCEDLRLEGKRWAVKEIALSTSGRAEFEREASLLSQLDHPRVPMVVDYFVLGQHGYLVREYLDGPSLYQQVEKQGPVSEARALQWGVQIAEVLAYLHQRKPALFHRDLKPQNLILLSDGIRLIDFGLAQEEGNEAPPPQGGSASFTAPEQFQAGTRPAATADIYSLGAILYYALTATPPGPTGGEHRLRPHRPEIAPETEEVVLQCMHSDPSKRPQDVEELLHTLQFAAMKLPEPTPQSEVADLPATPSQLRQRTQQAGTMPLLAWLPLLIVAAGLGFCWVYIYNWGRSHPSAPPPAVSEPTQLQDSAEWARVLEFEKKGRDAEAEATLQSKLAGDPGSGWATLGLLRNQLLRQNPKLPRIPLLLPLGGEEQEHINWILQGIALGQKDEKRFIFDLVDTHQEPVLQTWERLRGQRPGMVLGPFGSQDALLIAPLAAGSGVPVLPIGSADPRLKVAGPGIFPAAFPHSDRLGVVLEHAVLKLGSKGVILYSADSKAMASSAESASEKLVASGHPAPTTLAYAEGEDLEKVVGALNSADPDWIYLSENHQNQAATWIARLRQAGIKAPVVCVFHPASDSFLSLLKGVPGQVWLVEPLWQQRNAEFVSRCRKTYSSLVVDWNSALGFDVAKLASRCWLGGDASKNLHKLRSSPSYQGLLGDYDLAGQSFKPYPFRYQMIAIDAGIRQPPIELATP